MKLNDQLNLQGMGYSPRNLPASKIFLPHFWNWLRVFAGHRLDEFLRKIQHLSASDGKAEPERNKSIERPSKWRTKLC